MSIEDNIRAFYAKAQADIVDVGQTIIGVQGDPLYVYTVGNSRRGLADLIIVANIDPGGLMALLNDLAAHQALLDRSFVPGDVVQPEGFTLPVRLAATPEDVEETHCFQAAQIEKGRNEPRTYLQALLPDPNGKFPDEPGYSWPCNQVILRRLN